MNAPTKAETLQSLLPAIFDMPETQAIATLANSLYPGAQPDSVLMVLNYCRAARLDPMQKPVHLVPMNVKVGTDGSGKDMYAKRDTVMPGIGLYRIQAVNTGAYAGQDEPEFGPLRTFTYSKKITEWVDGKGGRREKVETWKDCEVHYPEWCKVTVYRFVQGVKCAWVAKELWLENYGTASRWSDAPNEMWEKRTQGQLAKCAEAQALRKAFPDAVGTAPTADEMEGKRFDFDLDEDGTATPAQTPAPITPPRKEKAEAATPKGDATPQDTGEPPPPWDETKTKPATAAPATAAPAATGGAVGYFPATGGEKQNILIKARNAKRDMRELLTKLGEDVSGIDPTTLDGLTKEQFKSLKKLLG